jgi:hypothetical protein
MVLDLTELVLAPGVLVELDFTVAFVVGVVDQVKFG